MCHLILNKCCLKLWQIKNFKQTMPWIAKYEFPIAMSSLAEMFMASDSLPIARYVYELTCEEVHGR